MNKKTPNGLLVTIEILQDVNKTYDYRQQVYSVKLDNIKHSLIHFDDGWKYIDNGQYGFVDLSFVSNLIEQYYQQH